MKTNMTDKCPECGENSLQYSQTADIVFKLIQGRLIPQLDDNSIGWHDSTCLYCYNCYANDADFDEIAEIKFEYDHNI